MSEVSFEIKGPRGLARLSDLASFCQAMRIALSEVGRCIANETDFEIDVTQLSIGSARVCAEPAEIGQVASHAICRSFEEAVGALENGHQVDSRLDYSALRAFSRFKTTVERKDATVVVCGVGLTESFVANVERLLRSDVSSLGSVTGHLDALNVHNRRQFVLYPPIRGEEVICKFKKEDTHRIVELLEKNVTVYGLLHYHRAKAFPVKVDVHSFRAEPDNADLPDLLDACGILSSNESSNSVGRIGKTRDEW